MELKFSRARWSSDPEGLWVSLLVERDAAAAAREWIRTMPDRPHLAAIKLFRPRRSLDANAYFWVLLGRLAAQTGNGNDQLYKTELYRGMIREIGGNSDTVCIPSKGVERLRRTWEGNGQGWIVETSDSKLPGCTNVTLYYGSSTYDAGQMARLIDLAVMECKQFGVETMTPAELARIKEDWSA